MPRRRSEPKSPGYAKLLDAWTAPPRAEDPIGCIVTSYTFEAPFFEDHCLSRFLQMHTDQSEDGPCYLIEKEEKLNSVSCAAAIVDGHHCCGSRNPRWDLFACRTDRQHAKISLLYWSGLCRVIISSANLTEAGYRRNLEIFGILDFYEGSSVPISALTQSIDFLARLVQASTWKPPNANLLSTVSPSADRALRLLDRVRKDCREWGVSEEENRRSPLQIAPVFCGDGQKNLFESLRELWPSSKLPTQVDILSPFFDRPEAPNAPARAVWSLLPKRGETTVRYHLTGDLDFKAVKYVLNAPASLLAARDSSNSKAMPRFSLLEELEMRSLHAKVIRLRNSQWILSLIGSSNFTSAGTGLSKRSNFEANLAYAVDGDRDPDSIEELEEAFPESFELLDNEIQWKEIPIESESLQDEVSMLPDCFQEAILEKVAGNQLQLRLRIVSSTPSNWELLNESNKGRIAGETEWMLAGEPKEWVIPWHGSIPPSGFWVRWKDCDRPAWWPVNIADQEVLPPIPELRDLPLDVLINLLTSRRPLHLAIVTYIQFRRRSQKELQTSALIDPHRRVDTSQYVLQRTRRVSIALQKLREKLEERFVTIEALQWRLTGPISAEAIADAIERESQARVGSMNSDEVAFLFAELALELSRVRPSKDSSISRAKVRGEIREFIRHLHKRVRKMAPQANRTVHAYLKEAFKEALR